MRGMQTVCHVLLPFVLQKYEIISAVVYLYVKEAKKIPINDDSIVKYRYFIH